MDDIESEGNFSQVHQEAIIEQRMAGGIAEIFYQGCCAQGQQEVAAEGEHRDGKRSEKSDQENEGTENEAETK